MSRTIVVVSGLPRSGTSLIMQMLRAGGLEVLTDGVRPADEDNPRGYFEFEPVKRLEQDASWLPSARGKAVKIIAQLLPFLPAGLEYRVIFMERNLDEVIRSQNKMLERSGRPQTPLADERLKEIFTAQVNQAKAWLAARAVPHLTLVFSECLGQPKETAGKINSFLGERMKVSAMAAAVDQGLYRQRS
ncbi:MAG: sulfotransferase family protein [Thermodesulfobacteriota bacterium]